MKNFHSDCRKEPKILIFGGTTEGRKLAQILAKNKIECELRVATEYGEQVVENSDLPEAAFSHIHIKTGRLSQQEMLGLFQKNHYIAVVDATHPFATEVSENIKKCFWHSERGEQFVDNKSNPFLIRLERNINHIEENNLFYFDDDEKCALALENLLQKKSDAKILLTTGSKNLHIFSRNENLRKHLVARVLPSVESIKICGENGLEGKQIIAMQGPFSQKMNEVQIRDFKISVLVTKESGRVGGVDEKIEAAKKCKIKCFVIKRNAAIEFAEKSANNYIITNSIRETCKNLSKILSKKIVSNATLKISLCGIGMGNPKNLTREVEDAIQSSELVFGARRMIENLETSAKRFPFYIAKDIIPILKKSQEENFDEVNAAVLFSGDTGFFSGAAKFYSELKNLENAEVKILPGISSLSYLSAKTGVNYENTKIISTHGVEEKIWKPEMQNLLEKMSDKNSIFFLTSGAEDIQKIGEILHSEENNRHTNGLFKVILGFNLSYGDEKILHLSAEDCARIETPGLYCGFIVCSPLESLR